MAEKGILIENQTGGESIAMRDAYLPDEASNPRLIQRVNFDVSSCRNITSPMGAPMRSGVAAADSLDLSSMPADLTDNIIDMGDSSMLVVFTEFLGAGGQDLTFYPVIFDTVGVTEDDVIGVLEEQWSGAYADAQLSRNTDGTQYLGPRIHVPTLGAPRIGLLVNYCGVTTTVSLWGYAL